MARIILGIAFLLSFLAFQARSAQPGADEKKSTTPLAQAATDAKKAVPASKPADKKKAPEAMGKIDGISIPRPSGTWLGLDGSSGRFCLSFYDAKKKPVPADAVRATARWHSPRLKNPFFDVLNPSSDGEALFGNNPVTPPRNFKVYLTLEGGNGQVMESYVVDYRE
ncbi:MAG: hypothetical protein WC378_16265 [Opitutaceae bacterium]